MELKKPNHLPTLAEINVDNSSERKNSQDQGMYNILFPPEEEEPDTSIEDKYANNVSQKVLFGNVSTLDWLKTWRSTQTS
jgi:hypothetical protein